MLRAPADVVRARPSGSPRSPAEPSSRPSRGPAAARCRSPSSRATPARSRRSSPRRCGSARPPVIGIVRDGKLLLDCRTLTDDEVEEAARAVPFAHADGRHRRPHRPRQDLARPGADREGHRPAARGAGARHLDRPRLRAARAARTAGGSRSSTSRARALRRNMVAGATGIDLFLLVVDAGEGARPQTHEHLAIIRLLGIEHGVVAITKADAVDEETQRSRSRRRASSFPAPRSSSRARRPARASTSCAPRWPRSRTASSSARGRATRLFVDRVFSLRGIGTVVTGRSGRLDRRGRRARAPSRRGIDVRVRSVQVHDRPVERAEAGQRVAVALPGVERERPQARRRAGRARRVPGQLPPRRRARRARADLRRRASCTSTTEPPSTTRGSSASASRYAQLRLASPAVAARGDRVVLRDRTTVGGGPSSTRARLAMPTPAGFELLERGDVAALVHAPVRAAPARASPRASSGGSSEPAMGVLAAPGSRSSRRASRRASGPTRSTPASPPPPSPGRATSSRSSGSSAAGRACTCPARRRPRRARRGGAALERELEGLRLRPVKVEDPELGRYLEREGRLVRVGDGYAVGRGRLRAGEAHRGRGVRASRLDHARPFRDLLGTPRARSASARALRRRRAHPAHRRGARPQAAGEARRAEAKLEPAALVAAVHARGLVALDRLAVVPCRSLHEPAQERAELAR